ncbi:MAG: MFS transporter [Sphaerochaetaceae bacterium]|nr:MFS transporter [Sphaerochaetaceae bacterium]
MKSLYLKARAACALLLVIEFCSGLVFFSPVSTLYRQSRGVNISQIGIIESISLAVMMALEIPWGTLAEKIGYKKTLMICSLLSLVSKIMFWKADSFLLFLLERIVLSFALAGISGVDYAYISSFLKPDQMTRFFGRYNGVSTMGLLCASLIFSVFLKDNYSLSAFLTMIAYALSFLLSLFLPEEERRAVQGEKKKFSWHISKAMTPVLVSCSLVLATGQSLTVFISQLKYSSVGMTSSIIGIAHIIMICTGIVSSLLSYRLSERFGKRNAIAICFAASLAGCILALFASSAISCIVAICILKAGVSAVVPIYGFIQCSMADPDGKAVTLSSFALAGELAEMVLSSVYGAIAQASIGLLFGSASLVCLLAMTVLMLDKKPLER